MRRPHAFGYYARTIGCVKCRRERMPEMLEAHDVGEPWRLRSAGSGR